MQFHSFYPLSSQFQLRLVRKVKVVFSLWTFLLYCICFKSDSASDSRLLYSSSNCKVHLIENKVNDRQLKSTIFHWKLKSFIIANIDYKIKFLYGHQFWLEIYSGHHLHLFTDWLMCSSLVCLENVEWLSWLNHLRSLSLISSPSFKFQCILMLHVFCLFRYHSLNKTSRCYSCTVTQ